MWRPASRKSSKRLGTYGRYSSGIRACSGVRAPLRPLHAAQAETRFIQLHAPPRLAGTMCSHCSSRSWKRNPQYAQVMRSRRKSLCLATAGAASNRLTRAAPRSAMIGYTSIVDCRPASTFQPPRSVRSGLAPSNQATASVA